VHGEQKHEDHLGKLHERIGDPPEEPVEPCLAVDGEPERQEMQRQEDRQGDAREAMNEKGDPKDAAAMRCAGLSRRVAHYSVTATTALRPRAARMAPAPSIRASSWRPLRPVHSDATTRTPMAPCVAAASTNSP